ncbi:MAG: hypothetical protein HYZ89_00215 [Candidatus Omnitrophica bacterium]|nr:hypothetical protein [Candidatus Omnitrophota bacterium]
MASVLQEDEYEDFERYPDEVAGPPRDEEIDRAKPAVLKLYANGEEVYYGRQIEVFLEKRFFHWITNKAIRELIRGGKLKAEVRRLNGNMIAHFMFLPNPRYYKRQANELLDVIVKYSYPVVTERDELESKLEMCKFLKIRPVFIMRQSAKSYNKMMIDQGGYVMLFDKQVYPPNLQSLVEEVRDKTGLPVVASDKVPDSILDRFLKWHSRSL